MSFNKTINQQQNKFQPTNSMLPPVYIPLAEKERLASALFALAGCSQHLREACMLATSTARFATTVFAAKRYEVKPLEVN
jgi:hypothetical protein